MEIVKKDSFRSQGILVNKTDDMYRVIVDMKRTEYPQFAKLIESQNNTHDCLECGSACRDSDGILMHIDTCSKSQHNKQNVPCLCYYDVYNSECPQHR